MSGVCCDLCSVFATRTSRFNRLRRLCVLWSTSTCSTVFPTRAIVIEEVAELDKMVSSLSRLGKQWCTWSETKIRKRNIDQIGSTALNQPLILLCSCLCVAIFYANKKIDDRYFMMAPEVIQISPVSGYDDTLRLISSVAPSSFSFQSLICIFSTSFQRLQSLL